MTIFSDVCMVEHIVGRYTSTERCLGMRNGIWSLRRRQSSMASSFLDYRADRIHCMAGIHYDILVGQWCSARKSLSTSYLDRSLLAKNAHALLCTRMVVGYSLWTCVSCGHMRSTEARSNHWRWRVSPLPLNGERKNVCKIMKSFITVLVPQSYGLDMMFSS